MVISSTISHNFKSETTVPSVAILSKSQLASQFSMTPDTKQQAFRDSLTFLIVSSETIGSLAANAPTDSSALVYVDSQSQDLMFKPSSNSAGLLPNTFKLKIVSSYQAFDVAITLKISQKCDPGATSSAEYFYIIED